MKNLLFLLLLIPVLSFSQTSSWRNNPPTSNSNSSSSSSPRVSTNTSSVSKWRNSEPKEFNKPRTNNTVIIRDPWFDMGWNRWNRWGGPQFGWNSYIPTWYFNDWGYRQPARVYYYNDGKTDTIKGKRPIYSFGLHHTTNNQMGMFFTVGNKGYFIFDFNTTYKRDRSTFFPHGTIDQVDFPLISDLVKENGFYIGAGKRINRFGFHVMVGLANERVLWRGKDDVGEITFPKSQQKFATFKFGTLKDFKNFTLKVDYDPVIRYGQMGIGLNF